MLCQQSERLTFQFFIVFVVHMSVRVAALAEEAALMVVCHMLPKLILAIEPLVTKTAQIWPSVAPHQAVSEASMQQAVVCLTNNQQHNSSCIAAYLQ